MSKKKVFFYNTTTSTGNWRFNPNISTHDLDVMPFLDYYKALGYEIHTNILHKKPAYTQFDRHPDVIYHQGSPLVHDFDEVYIALHCKSYYFFGGRMRQPSIDAFKALFVNSKLKNPVKLQVGDPRPFAVSTAFMPQTKWLHPIFYDFFTQAEVDKIMDGILSSTIVFTGSSYDGPIEGYNRTVLTSNHPNFVPSYLPEAKAKLEPELWTHDVIYPLCAELRGDRRKAFSLLLKWGLNLATIRKEVKLGKVSIPLLTKEFLGMTEQLKALSHSKFQLINCEQKHLDYGWKPTPRAWQSLASNSLAFRLEGPGFDKIGSFDVPLVKSLDDLLNISLSNYDNQVEAFNEARKQKVSLNLEGFLCPLNK